MKKVKLIIVALLAQLVFGCGVADTITNRCGGDIDPWCDFVFGHDNDEIDARITKNEQKIESLEYNFAIYNAQVTALEQDVDSNQDSIDSLESLLADLQADIAEIETRTTVSEVVDPCGNSRWRDEVLLVMSDGSIVAYFEESGGRRFLSTLGDGAYRTTDRQRCRFSVVNGEIRD